jgi:hypothetical protein
MGSRLCVGEAGRSGVLLALESAGLPDEPAALTSHHLEDLSLDPRNGSGLRQGHVCVVPQSPPVRPNRMLASAANETKSRVMLKKTMSAG